MDNLTASDRKKCMSRIRSKNTKPEKMVRRILTDMGLRYRLHKKELSGKPDIVLSKYKLIFFINGCFWHQHKNCKYATMPKSNLKYWSSKFKRNIERQNNNIQVLSNTGWQVEIIWECEMKNMEQLKTKIKDIFYG